MGIQVLLELSFTFLGLLLIIYGAWLYSKRKEKPLRYLALSFIFLTLSTTLQASETLILDALPMIGIRILEIISLALYACFIISMVIALKRIITKAQKD